MSCFLKLKLNTKVELILIEVLKYFYFGRVLSIELRKKE